MYLMSGFRVNLDWLHSTLARSCPLSSEYSEGPGDAAGGFARKVCVVLFGFGFGSVGFGFFFILKSMISDILYRGARGDGFFVAAEDVWRMCSGSGIFGTAEGQMAGRSSLVVFGNSHHDPLDTLASTRK